MRGYAVQEVFTRREMALLKRATAMVQRIPAKINLIGINEWVRCHELARAIGSILKLEVCDGWYGFVEHSWLWTSPPDKSEAGHVFGQLPNVLDVYMPGHLPQVQLVHMSANLLLQYRPGIKRDDIIAIAVEALTDRASGQRRRH